MTTIAVRDNSTPDDIAIKLSLDCKSFIAVNKELWHSLFDVNVTRKTKFKQGLVQCFLQGVKSAELDEQ